MYYAMTPQIIIMISFCLQNFIAFFIVQKLHVDAFKNSLRSYITFTFYDSEFESGRVG